MCDTCVVLLFLLLTVIISEFSIGLLPAAFAACISAHLRCFLLLVFGIWPFDFLSPDSWHVGITPAYLRSFRLDVNLLMGWI